MFRFVQLCLLGTIFFASPAVFASVVTGPPSSAQGTTSVEALQRQLATLQGARDALAARRVQAIAEFNVSADAGTAVHQEHENHGRQRPADGAPTLQGWRETRDQLRRNYDTHRAQCDILHARVGEITAELRATDNQIATTNEAIRTAQQIASTTAPSGAQQGGSGVPATTTVPAATTTVPATSTTVPAATTTVSASPPSALASPPTALASPPSAPIVADFLDTAVALRTGGGPLHTAYGLNYPYIDCGVGAGRNNMYQAFFPAAPIFHPYNLDDCLSPPRCLVNLRIPAAYYNSVPQAIRETIRGAGIDPRNVDLVFVTQNLPWGDDLAAADPRNNVLFRPHYWYYPVAPYSTPRGGAYYNNTVNYQAGYLTGGRIDMQARAGSQDHNIHVHTADVITADGANAVVASPAYAPVAFQPNALHSAGNSYAVWTLAIVPSTGRAVVTLHWLLNDIDHETLEEAVAEFRGRSLRDLVGDLRGAMNAGLMGQLDQFLTIPPASAALPALPSSGGGADSTQQSGGQQGSGGSSGQQSGGQQASSGSTSSSGSQSQAPAMTLAAFRSTSFPRQQLGSAYYYRDCGAGSGRTRQYGRNFPLAPLFHPYDPSSEYAEAPRSYVSMRLPPEAYANLPEPIRETLEGDGINPANVDVLFVTQDLPWAAADASHVGRVLLRPHYWACPDAPYRSQSYDVRIRMTRAACIDSEGIENGIHYDDGTAASAFSSPFLLWNHTEADPDDNQRVVAQQGHIARASPQRSAVYLDPAIFHRGGEVSALWTVVVLENGRAAVTLHWCLSDLGQDLVQQVVAAGATQTVEELVNAFGTAGMPRHMLTPLQGLLGIAPASATTASAAPTTASAAPTTASAAPTTASAAPTTASAAPTTASAAPTTASAAPVTTPTTGGPSATVSPLLPSTQVSAAAPVASGQGSSGGQAPAAPAAPSANPVSSAPLIPRGNGTSGL